MARYLGEIVHYIPHAEHTHMVGREYAAIVTEVNPDGSADLTVFVPNREPVHFEDVPVGDSHHCHRSIQHPA